ncbi:MAG: hypothetical protein D4R58_00085 [Betaproteobacteria bacterium]|nr:MAG: hypothetical protein D4R58_00085 [Betaproteobacteria bacterium]
MLRQVDSELAALERRGAEREVLPLAPTVERALELVGRLIAACIVEQGGKEAPDPAADLLAAFKVLVKGEPSWNAIRDNCRELVYYRNCIKMGRLDALPAAPAKMTVRTARHIFLYIKTRCIRDAVTKI